MLAELQRLYDLGWRRSVFVVDDNFIGNKKHVRGLLRELQPWMREHDYPFSFATEASLDLAQDQALMDGMVACNFRAVFVGIETPDVASLTRVGKTQNARSPLDDSVAKITRAGLRVMAGFIIGFDGEQAGAGGRIVDFVERTAIPTVAFSMLQALPGTALTQRLASEGRLLTDLQNGGDLNQTTLTNFVPTRDVEQIADEYVEAFWELYDPVKYLDRVFRHYAQLEFAAHPRRSRPLAKKVNTQNLRAMLLIFWKQGIVRRSRWRFWRNLFGIIRVNSRAVGSYLSGCAQGEHFLDYRQRVKRTIRAQLAQRQKSAVSAPVGLA
jgi:radical SAM superfamily enzyme YgiQ (UPF0313 family)